MENTDNIITEIINEAEYRCLNGNQLVAETLLQLLVELKKQPVLNLEIKVFHSENSTLNGEEPQSLSE